LVGCNHDRGRDCDSHHDGRVGQGPSVGREVLALDDGQQRHETDVDEELCASYRPEQRLPTTADDVPPPENGGHGRVTDGCAETRDNHQRPPTAPVHNQREWNGGHQYDQAQVDSGGVGRYLGARHDGRRVRLQHASTTGHLQHGQHNDDNQRATVSVYQVFDAPFNTAKICQKGHYKILYHLYIITRKHIT